MSVKTVLGTIEASQVGICAPHEHIYIDMNVFLLRRKK